MSKHNGDGMLVPKFIGGLMVVGVLWTVLTGALWHWVVVGVVTVMTLAVAKAATPPKKGK